MIAPSGACSRVPKKIANASTRSRVESLAQRAPTNVTSVAMIVKNATTRFENSMYEWKLFGSK